MAESNIVDKMTESSSPVSIEVVGGTERAKAEPIQWDLFSFKPPKLYRQEELNAIEETNRLQKEKLENEYSYGDIAKQAGSLEWISAWYLRQSNREDLLPDPSFNPTVETYKEVMKSFNIENIEYIEAFNEAQSHAQLLQIAGEIKEIENKEKILNSKGLATGLTARILATVLDPVAWAAVIATEGVIAPTMLMSKLTRTQRFIRGGLAGATANSAIEGYLYSQNPTMDVDDILYSALFGFGLGGTLSSIGRGLNPDELEFNKAVHQMEKGQIRNDIETNDALELTQKGQEQLDVDPNYSFNSTKTDFDAEDPLETIDGKIRTDGINETKIKDGEEYMQRINEDGSITVRKCT